MKSKTRILVAGIGNIFLGDDAFGSEVARRLTQRTWPEGVRVEDFGIRGFDLAFALLDDHELAILIDATPRGGAPGTLYQIEPDLNEVNELDQPDLMLDTHGMNPMKVLAMVKSMGGEFRKVLLVGCEPAPLDADEGALGLSAAAQAAVEEAVPLVSDLVQQHLAPMKAVAGHH